MCWSVYSIVGGGDIEITGNPTPAEWAVLVIVALVPPLMALVGWLVSRLRSGRTRTVAAGVSVAVVACEAMTVTGPSQLLQEAVVIVAVLILTGCGVGSVVGWAVRMMLSHFATVGALAVRALPVVLLTALVFFNTYVWLMAATISGNRLGTGDGVSDHHRRGLRHLRNAGTGQADAAAQPRCCPRTRQGLPIPRFRRCQTFVTAPL